MSTEVIAVGEKVHIITRRTFKEDIRRHFAGVVTAVGQGMVRAEGHAFIVSAMGSDVRRLAGLRIRVFGMADSGNITNILPPNVSVADLSYKVINSNLVISDGRGFTMEVNETK